MTGEEFRKNFSEAARLYAAGNFSRAAHLLVTIIESYPDHPHVLHTYARCLIKLERFDEAAALCERLSGELKDERGRELLESIAKLRGEDAEPEETAGRGPSKRLALTALGLALGILGLYAYFIAYPRIFRVMPFPERATFGDLYTKNPNDPGDSWRPAGPARGKVALRRSLEIRLVLAPAIADDPAMRFLLELEADTFSEIDASNAPLGDDGLKTLARFRRVRRLVLSNANLHGPGLVHLEPEMPLTFLDLSGNPIGDEWLPWVGQISALKTLDLRETEITDAGLASLAALSALNRLDLPNTAGDEGLKAIRALTNLRTLDLAGRPVTDRGMKFVAELPNLTELDLSATPITDTGVARLAALSQLRSLDLSDTYITDDALAAVARMTQLRSLILDGTNITPEGLRQLASHAKLKVLRVARCFPGGGPPALFEGVLEGFPALTELDLSGGGVGDASIVSFAHPGLNRLVLKDSRVSAEGISQLRARLPQCEIDYEPRAGVEFVFPDETSLARVSLRESSADEDSPWQFAGEARGRLRLPDDVDLYLELTPAGARNLDALSPLLTRRTTRIALSEIGEPTPSLIETLNALDGLSSLDLSDANWNDSTIRQLRPTEILKSLNLSGTRVTGQVLSHLAEFTALAHLDVRGTTAIDPEALTQLSSLKSLDLRDTRAGRAEAAIVQAALPDLTIRYDRKDTRSVRFPSGASLGKVWSRPSDDPDSPWTPIGEARGIVSVPGGHVLRLDFPEDGSAAPALLASLAPDALHTLYLTGPRISDQSLRHIAGLTGLKVLNLFASKVTDEGLRFLTSISPLAALAPAGSQSGFAQPFLNLEELGMNRTRVTNAGLEHVGAFAGLRSLDLAATRVGSNGLQHVKRARNLERLAIEGTVVTSSAHREFTASSPKISVTYQPFRYGTDSEDPYAARVLSGNGPVAIGAVYLRSVKLTGRRGWILAGPLDDAVAVRDDMQTKLVLEPRDLAHINALSGLGPESLHIVQFPPGAQITGDIGVLLSGIQSLETIDFTAATIERGALKPIARLPRLKELILHAAKIAPGELAAVRGLASLTSLDISGTQAGDSALIDVASCKNLTRLDLHGNEGLGDLGVRFASELRNIERLDLHETPVSAKALKSLENVNSLKFLDVYGTSIPQDAVTAYKDERIDTAINFDKRRLNAYEVSQIAPKLRETKTPPTRRSLAKALGVSSLRAVAPETLNAIHRVIFDSLGDSETPIDSEFLAEISGADRLADVPEDIRAPLQKMALQTLAKRNRRITIDELAQVASARRGRAIDEAELDRLQGYALHAMAQENEGIDSKDLQAIEGVRSFGDISEDRLPEIQERALKALTDSDAGLTVDGLEAVGGVDRLDALGPERLTGLQTIALSAMADSATGITPKTLAALEGREEFSDLSKKKVAALQKIAMSAMANSGIGITTQGMSALDGQDHYEDMLPESMDHLQSLAVETMVDSDLPLTSESIAQIGGRDDFQELPEERLDGLQQLGLQAMAHSPIGITVDSLVELGGVEEFDELEQDALSALQTKALTAMADSYTGITLDGLATVAGATDLGELSDVDLSGIRIKAVTAMANSSIGIVPSALIKILGDTALEVLDLSGTSVTDTDLFNLPDFSMLREVDLSGCRSITDRGIDRLARAEQLESLNLAGTKVTDYGLYALTGMSNLRHLDLSRTAITDHALTVLNNLPELETLALSETGIDGAGLVHLASTPRLRHLELQYTGVTDDGFSKLPALDNLVSLNLTHTRISDESLALFSRFGALDELELAQCPSITDDGFRELARYVSLSSLKLHDTDVSETSLSTITEQHALRYLTVNQARFSMAALESIEDALPNCMVQGIGMLRAEAEALGELRTQAAGGGELLASMASFGLTAGRALYSVLVIGFALGLALAPFAPLYLEGFGRMQEAGVFGKSVQGAATGAYATSLFVNRASRAMAYATRWGIFILVAGVVIYVCVLAVSTFFENYLASGATRF